MEKNFVLSHICLNLAIGSHFRQNKKSQSVKLNVTHAQIYQLISSMWAL